ncbi:hypothetical protein ACUW5M_004205 [Providencia stuartii]
MMNSSEHKKKPPTFWDGGKGSLRATPNEQNQKKYLVAVILTI